MAYGDIGAVIDTLEFDTSQAFHTSIIKRSNSIAAIFYSDLSQPANIADVHKIVTVEVNAAGAITDTVKDSLTVGGAWASLAAVAERTPGIYVGVGDNDFDAGGLSPWAFSFSVGAAGELPGSIIDNLELSAGGLYDIDIIHLYQSIMVEADVISGHHGELRTFTCAEGGALGASVIETHRFASTTGAECELFKISDGVVALVTTDSGGELKLWTFLINSSGNIATPAHDTVILTSHGSSPTICQVIGNIYAIAYEGGGADGYICTIDIDSAGNIGASTIDTYEFDIANCLDPSMCKVKDGIVAVAYAGPVSPGYIKTLAIDAAGDITDPYLDTLTYEAVESEAQAITYMQGHIYLVSFKGPGRDGFVVAIDVETPAAAAAIKNLMMIGIG